MHTLIYHDGALGDFITTLPVIAYIKRYSGAFITLLGKPSFGQLGRDVQLIDAFINADGRSHRYLFLDTTEELAARAFFDPFDAVLIFALADSPLIANARCFSRVGPLHQPPFPDNASLHIIDYHLSLLPVATEIQYLDIPAIALPDELTTLCRKKYGIDHQPYAVIHPGSGSAIKNWPFGRYLKLAEEMRRHGLIIGWLTGPADPSYDLPQGDRHLTAATLTECTAILEGCAIYIGNDSGITHLAAASGCPVVALFGPSDPAVWGPRGRGSIAIIHHRPADCTPCHRQLNRNLHCTGRCLDNIFPDEVSAVALKLAARVP